VKVAEFDMKLLLPASLLNFSLTAKCIDVDSRAVR
jgi:hypothetical protein